jgi:dihydrodipicolinate synthase/N-acetylneuraminate lyase
MLIDGIQIPLTAPFYRDGASYWRKLEHNVGRYSLTPAAGLVAMPPGGEAGALSDAEVAETLQVVSSSAAREKVLTAGIAKDSVRGALWVAEQAAQAGFDAVLLSALEAKLSADELGVYFAAVADSSALPVVISGGMEISLKRIAELAAHKNVIGIYGRELTTESARAIAEATREKRCEVDVTAVFAPVTGRMKAQVAGEGAATFVSAESLGGGTGLAVAPPKPAIKTRTKVVGFQTMAAGNAEHLVELLEVGVAGAMLRLAACAPQACHEVYAAFKDGNSELARDKAARLREADVLMLELGIAGVKYACDLNGYYGGTPRLPKLALTGIKRKRVEQVMAALRA